MNEQVPGDNGIVQEVAVETPPPEEQPLDETPLIGPPMEPVREPERIHALDVLRGFAIFGIFMVNIAFFSMPLMEAIGQGVGEETAVTALRTRLLRRSSSSSLYRRSRCCSGWASSFR